MAQLGKAVSILLKFEIERNAAFEDLGAFHAPSECAPLVARGLARRFRTTRRHACHIAGVKNLRQLRARIKAVCPTWDRYNHYRLGIQEI